MWLFNTQPPDAAAAGYTGPNVSKFGEKFEKAFENAFDYTRVENFFIQLEKDAFKMGQDLANGVQVFQKAFESSMYEAWAATQDLGVDMKTVVDYATNYGKELKKIPNISTEMTKEMIKYHKATGMAMSEIGAMVGKFAAVGLGQQKTMEKMKEIYKTARKYGVDANTLTSTVRDNISKASLYGFKNGIDGLTKMAARAQQLGTDFKNIMKIAEKALDPDQAIQMAAEMQMLGGEVGALGDPFQLLYLAQNDIGKLQEEFTKVTESAVDFNATTGEFKIPVQEMYRLRAMADKLGLSYDEVAESAIKAAKQQEVLARVKLPSNFSDEDKNLIASLAEIKGGEVMITIPGTKELVNAANLTEAQLQDIKDNVGPDETMEDIAKKQLASGDKAAISLANMENTMIRWFGDSNKYQEHILQNLRNLASATDVATGQIKGQETGLGNDMVRALTNVVTLMTEYLRGGDPGQFGDHLQQVVEKIKDYQGSPTPNQEVTFSASPRSQNVITGQDVFIPRAGNDVVTGSKGQFFTGIPEDDVLYAPNIRGFLKSAELAFSTIENIENFKDLNMISVLQSSIQSMSENSQQGGISLIDMITQNLATPTKPTENLGVNRGLIDEKINNIGKIISQSPEIDVDSILNRSLEKITEIQNLQNTQTSTQKVEGSVGVDGNVNINVNIPDGYLSTAFSSDRDFQISIKEQILNVVNHRLSKAYSQGQGNLG